MELLRLLQERKVAGGAPSASAGELTEYAIDAACDELRREGDKVALVLPAELLEECARLLQDSFHEHGFPQGMELARNEDNEIVPTLSAVVEAAMHSFVSVMSGEYWDYVQAELEQDRLTGQGASKGPSMH